MSMRTHPVLFLQDGTAGCTHVAFCVSLVLHCIRIRQMAGVIHMVKSSALCHLQCAYFH